MSRQTGKRYTGAVHLHTTLSHDGVLFLDELVDFARRRGYDFVAITEHSQDLTQASLTDLDVRSANLTTSDVLIIPGVEFTCAGNIHMLGLGVIRLCEFNDPDRVLDHIHACGGMAILAHPSHQNYPIETKWLRKLDACEIWNNRNGKWLPQMKAVRKYQELAGLAPGLRAISGLDLHGPQGYSHVATWVSAGRLTREEILTALKRGAYTTGGRFLRIPPDGHLSLAKTLYIRTFRMLLNTIRWFRNHLAPN